MRQVVCRVWKAWATTNPNRKIFEARKRETAALGAGEKLVLGHPLAATIGDSARCMQNLEKAQIDSSRREPARRLLTSVLIASRGLRTLRCLYGRMFDGYWAFQSRWRGLPPSSPRWPRSRSTRQPR